jgi:hypothetical protein
VIQGTVNCRNSIVERGICRYIGKICCLEPYQGPCDAAQIDMPILPKEMAISPMVVDELLNDIRGPVELLRSETITKSVPTQIAWQSIFRPRPLSQRS